MNYKRIVNNRYVSTKCECLIEGRRLEYDACSSGDLSEAKNYYKGFTYIGSSNIYYINGVEQREDGETHFFKRTV